MRRMIELKSVTKAYGAQRAVGPFDLSVAKGEFVALLGGSGSGKTTTLKMINGLSQATSGEVLIEGRDIAAEPPWQLRRRIGYVFQEIGLFPHMSVAENIAVGPRLAGWDTPRIAARTAELLDLVSLPRDMAARLPAALSGGQRQRVGVARALAAQPSIMLMDEPFGALDPVTRDALGAEYRALHERLGLTTVMVTHDVMEALLLADRIVVLEAGAVIADGTPAELLSAGQSEAVKALMDTPRRQAQRVAALADASHG
ncbi:MAG TPA: ABC transporter ATP-binding protein [Caulobacteraceae bacterium]